MNLQATYANAFPAITLRSFYAALISFLAYSAVYAFRKPFTIADFDGLHFFGVSYQTLLIISQVLGYMLSKFYGIKFISGLKRVGRWVTTAVLIGISWICLLIFAILPPPLGMLMLFLNGFMLGFMWGIIFSYIEGRTATDFIGTVMAISFIFAGGFTRSVAKWISIHWQVNDFWLPFITGLVFVIPLAVLIYLLEKLPAPSQYDLSQRSERTPMDNQDRKAFVNYFGLGLLAVSVTYFVLTILRDIRDNFMANFWEELGYSGDYSIYARTESLIALVILLLLSAMVLIKRNFRAFSISHAIIATGLLISGVSTLLFIQQIISGELWMQLTGLGLYLGYILFNCIFFERMIAAFRVKGNIGFVIYIVDAFGYLGSVTVMLSKSLFPPEINWTSFYSQGVIIGSGVGIAGTIASLIFFRRKMYRKIAETPATTNPVFT